jgi:hypothetical protein
LRAQDVARCTQLNVALEDLAPQFDHVKFVRIRSSEVFKNGKFSKAGLPTLLVYRGGKMVKEFIVPATADFPKEIKPKEVAQWLHKQDILRIPSGGVKELSGGSDEERLKKQY